MPVSSTAMADGSASPDASTATLPPDFGSAATAPCSMVPSPSTQ